MSPFRGLFCVLTLVLVAQSKVKNNLRKRSIDSENDIYEKSEVIVKFPTYALKMPPIITARRRTNSKLDPQPVSCSSSNVTTSVNEMRKKTKCVPRDTVVEVQAPDGAAVTPNTVVVKRCGGMCNAGKKCIPAQKKMAEFYVRTTNEKSLMVFCNSIAVPEDVDCKCGCVQKKRCLKDVQRYDTTLCKCVCTNKDEYEECLDKTDLNFKWFAKSCTCGCKQEKMCTTGTVWSRERCRCVLIN